MFDLGWGELLVIAVVALIAIGPKELPTVLRTLGQYMGKVKRMANEFQGQFQEALREAELTDLKKQAEDLTGDLKSLTDFSDIDPLAETQKDIERAYEAEPNTESEAALPGGEESGKSEPAAAETPALTETAPEQATVDAPKPEQPVPVAQEPAKEPVKEVTKEAVQEVAVAPVQEVAHEDLAPVETPPKPAGGAA